MESQTPPLTLTPSLLGLTPEEMCALIGEGVDRATFRARQIADWIYKKRAASFEPMSNLSTRHRSWLAEHFSLSPLRRVLVTQSSDTTHKLLLRCEDGSLIETVLIRAPQKGVGRDDARKTICISTQVGCAYGCKFCASGLAGWKRDLSAAEIVAQVLEVCRIEDAEATSAGSRRDADIAPIDNLVVMGMGEPLANYDNLLRALTALNAEWGLNFGARRMTISTSGLVPQIRRLAEEPTSFRLAVSLHGATNSVREQIMPVNRKYPLEALLPAIAHFSAHHKRMVTLEYILIEDVNDTPEQARELATIARDLHAHVNCIPYNTVPGLDWKRPSQARQEAFAGILEGARVSVTLRREKGHDINAACGQLRLQHEAEEGRYTPVPAKVR